jgi:hypothetical protein
VSSYGFGDVARQLIGVFSASTPRAWCEVLRFELMINVVMCENSHKHQ